MPRKTPEKYKAAANAAPKKPKHLRREDDPRLSKEPTPEPPRRGSSKTQHSTSVQANSAKPQFAPMPSFAKNKFNVNRFCSKYFF